MPFTGSVANIRYFPIVWSPQSSLQTTWTISNMSRFHFEYSASIPPFSLRAEVAYRGRRRHMKNTQWYGPELRAWVQSFVTTPNADEVSSWVNFFLQMELKQQTNEFQIHVTKKEVKSLWMGKAVSAVNLQNLWWPTNMYAKESHVFKEWHIITIFWKELYNTCIKIRIILILLILVVCSFIFLV